MKVKFAFMVFDKDNNGVITTAVRVADSLRKGLGLG